MAGTAHACRRAFAETEASPAGRGRAYPWCVRAPAYVLMNACHLSTVLAAIFTLIGEGRDILLGNAQAFQGGCLASFRGIFIFLVE